MGNRFNFESALVRYSQFANAREAARARSDRRILSWGTGGRRDPRIVRNSKGKVAPLRLTCLPVNQWLRAGAVCAERQSKPTL